MANRGLNSGNDSTWCGVIAGQVQGASVNCGEWGGFVMILMLFYCRRDFLVTYHNENILYDSQPALNQGGD